MKIILSIILFFSIQLQLFAQIEDRKSPGYDPYLADSLRSLINQSDNDSVKAYQLILLSWVIEGGRADSAFMIANQAYELAKRMNNKMLQVTALRAVGYNQRSMGEYAESLQTFLQALKILGYLSDEEPNSTTLADGSELGRVSLHEYAELQRNIGHVLGNVGNRTEQMIKYRKALEIHKAMNHERLIPNTTYNIAEVYLVTNKPDSAIILAESSLGYYEKEDVPFYVKTYLGNIYNIIGEANLLKKNYQLAEAAFLKAEKSNIQYNNLRMLIETQLFLSKLYNQKEEYASGLNYANKARNTSLEVGLKSNIGKSYAALATSYQALNMQDSGYYYLKLATPLLDSLNQLEKSNLIRFQNILFEENQNLQKIEQEKTAAQNRIRMILLLVTLGFILLIALLLYRNNRQKQKTNKVLESTLSNLKSTQTQLIQSEKMASLGELTAGIAHEIQNPLNFVNNFSEVSNELIEEMKVEFKKGELDEGFAIAEDIKQNLEKINHHGKRADAIVKGMLQHSRTSSGQKEPTDINALCDEYLRLAYHGLKAKDQSFNASFHFEPDDTLPKVDVVPQDIGRVLLNLINNAFQAVHLVETQCIASLPNAYTPTVTVSTKNLGDYIQISVSDNGPGIPNAIKDKIFQPFFTTKPAGQGTGLGLSLSYDIVKAHGGEIRINPNHNAGVEFVVSLHIN